MGITHPDERNTMTNLAKINFMTPAQYIGLETRKDNEIYNVSCAVVIDSYRDDRNFWRRWSDGFIEQRIVTSRPITIAADASSREEFTLLVPFGKFCGGHGVPVGNVGFFCADPFLDNGRYIVYLHNALPAQSTATGFEVHVWGYA